MGELIARYIRVLRDIGSKENLRMACGDMRVATILTNRGFAILVNPKRRELTTSYRVTALGTKELEEDMTDTTDTPPNNVPAPTAVEGTEGNKLIIPANANQAPPPVTVHDHVVSAFTVNAATLAKFLGVAADDHEALGGFKATIAAMRNMPPEALHEVTIKIIEAFFVYFKLDPKGTNDRKAMAAFDSNIALSIQDAAQHIAQNMQMQVQAQRDMEESLRHGNAGRR